MQRVQTCQKARAQEYARRYESIGDAFSKVFTIAIGAACLYAGSIDMFYGAKWSLTGMPMLFVGMLVLSTVERKRV